MTLLLQPAPASAVAATLIASDGDNRPLSSAIQRLALLGNHLPRQCGIATFTTDLGAAIAAEFPGIDCLVVAMNDAGRRHAYPTRVRFEIEENDVASYRRAVDFLNVSTVDVLSLQHEYGIFGGRAGNLVLPLLGELRMPLVTTLHTVLAKPDAGQRQVMDEVVRLSERLVVMSGHSAALLQRVHSVPAEKIDIIPHGIPEAMFSPGDKDHLGVAGKSVILTFGLLSPDKGIEHVVDALPAILEAYPDTVYIVLGATHPHVLEQSGETYRLMLEERARRLGVDGSMIFHNRFVSQAQLGEFLSATDIYITPYLNSEQSTSGTLAYAVGAGKAVISTPYRYASELLAGGRGILVPWRDSAAIAREVIGLLGNEERARGMRQKAARYGRGMAWGAVARRHVASLERAVGDHADRRRSAFHTRTLAERPTSLPDVNLDHLRCMTDDTGLLQHASFVVPRYAEGYCLDDNARALLLMVLLEEAGAVERRPARALASRYLAFVNHAFHPAYGRFRNFLTYERTWGEARGSEDSHGRALWALGTVVGRARDPARRSLSGDLFHAALPALTHLSSPRAWAYALLGLDEYLRTFKGDSGVQAMRELLTSRLADLYHRASSDDWPWFEDQVTYCNARLPQALIVSGTAMGREDLVAIGTRSLAWLGSLQHTPDGFFAPVGSNGFFRRGSTPARFDQQPVEACGMVAACLQTHRLTGDATWSRHARSAFGWFLGQNHLQQPLYDVSTGGCRDGLHADRVNENQGAESTLSFLLALWDMRAAERADLA
ncbi:MAG TPA: glycosyltransferase family 4 protein [Gemmatimonadales bacterium]|nr:glycosyltransferase family 4 protein [Gemmatimonadales bacterium]